MFLTPMLAQAQKFPNFRLALDVIITCMLDYSKHAHTHTASLITPTRTHDFLDVMAGQNFDTRRECFGKYAQNTFKIAKHMPWKPLRLPEIEEASLRFSLDLLFHGPDTHTACQSQMIQD
jgi:hypothetical protein